MNIVSSYAKIIAEENHSYIESTFSVLQIRFFLQQTQQIQLYKTSLR